MFKYLLSTKVTKKNRFDTGRRVLVWRGGDDVLCVSLQDDATFLKIFNILYGFKIKKLK